ncbi:MAG: CPBP family glutamic-type intramembrane protease, partial [Candidatus Acidiferrales bacterium]
MFDLWPSGGEVSAWETLWVWSFSLLPAGFPILCGLALRGRAWKGELAGMFRLGSPRDYGVALLVPLLSLAIPQLVVFFLSKITWELEQFFGVQLFSLDAFYAPSWFELSAFPPALLEEMAWRAYSLPLMIGLVGVRRGIFGVALLWGAWHFPSDVGGSALQVIVAVLSRLVFASVHSVALSWLYLR